MGLCPKNQPLLQELEDVKDFYDPLGTCCGSELKKYCHSAKKFSSY